MPDYPIVLGVGSNIPQDNISLYAFPKSQTQEICYMGHNCVYQVHKWKGDQVITNSWTSSINFKDEVFINLSGFSKKKLEMVNNK